MCVCGCAQYICLCTHICVRVCVKFLHMHVVYTNRCHTFLISFAKQRQSSSVLHPPCVLHLPLCVQCITFMHTHCSRLRVSVIHLVWSSFLIEQLMNGERRALQPPGHMATPPRLYQPQHCSFHASIYLSSSGQGSH